MIWKKLRHCVFSLTHVFSPAHVPRKTYSDRFEENSRFEIARCASTWIPIRFCHPFVPFVRIARVYANRFIIDQSGLSTPYRNLKNIYLIFYNRIFESTYPSFFSPPPKILVPKIGIGIRSKAWRTKVTKFSNRSQRSQIINYTSERNSNHRWARSDVYDRERGNPAACKPREPALSRAYKRETLSTGGFSNSYSCEADRCVFHSSSLPTSRTPTSFALRAWNGPSVLPIPLRFGSPPRYVHVRGTRVCIFNPHSEA